MGLLKDFLAKRELQTEIVSRYAGQSMKRYFGIDMDTYKPGSLDRKTKEMLGLVSSLVLRCNDCIFYHLNQLREMNATDEEIEEVLMIGLTVGGSVTIPHIREALKAWDSEKGESV